MKQKKNLSLIPAIDNDATNEVKDFLRATYDFKWVKSNRFHVWTGTNLWKLAQIQQFSFNPIGDLCVQLFFIFQISPQSNEAAKVKKKKSKKKHT